ncbi:NADPH:quinone reductase-like Zn-dependent oxidoreductase [Pedobacter cryoconitis]|uniref:NADPH:quinone reductase-like Zn-dependent oxidoreductase n=1 Tax=Pedobacter cryoconitis TaxID=188932 RepID=A0A7W9DX22_9SPHI|nr:zinc-dependent alcohol dehydrogenase family protein [Pedobacter cryoconitis]MBB5634461.1 NADPH:quinone reductase-like Zn-dependent oxidoreductase [Pedobacter cryoconitis]
MSTLSSPVMKALILENYGSPYILKEISRPVPGKGEVLVQIIASGVNPLDLKIKSGQAAHAQTRLPAILGVDMAGIIVETGKEVTDFKIGDEVYGLTGGVAGIQGSLAQYTAVDSRLIAIKPANLSMREAAAIPLSFITAWEGLMDRARVKKDKTVLIQGGTGGVGHMAIQLAMAKGATVFATGSAGKKSIIEAYGAIAIDFNRMSVAEYVKEYTSEEGFDVIFDTIGGDTLDASFKALKIYEGHLVSILGWGTHSLAPLSFRGATYSGVFTLLPLITGKNRSHHGEILKEAARLAEAGKLKPLLDTISYNMETITDAYHAMEQKTNQGKVVISI